MAEHSTIEWTDATWNPITGCTMVSAGCTNCYAMGLAATRLRNHPSRAGLTRETGGRAVWTGEVRLNEQWLDQPLRWKRPRKIFVCAHGDLFHEGVPDEWIDRVFAVMALAPWHTFQVLTKRPERAQQYLSQPGRVGDVLDACLGYVNNLRHVKPRLVEDGIQLLTLPNVWLGTSVEDQATADARIPHLLNTPAAVRFISAEPLLGPVDLTRALYFGLGGITMRGFLKNPDEPDDFHYHAPKLDWVIVGGESGPGARPMRPDWARSLRDQCQAAGVAFHFKQWGAWTPTSYENYPSEQQESDEIEGRLVEIEGQPMYRIGKGAAGRILDGRTWDEVPG